MVKVVMKLLTTTKMSPPNLVHDTAEESLAVNSDELQASINNEDPPGEVVQNPNGDRQNRPLNPIENIPSDPNQTTQGAVNRRPRPPKLTGLIQYMENVTEGKKILDSYKTNGRLKSTVRSELVRLIGKREENRAFKNIKAGEKLKKWDISHDRLETYAQEIEYEFDGEYAGTYFVAPRKEKGEHVRASGKLDAHFGYRKGELRKRGHLKEDNLPPPVVIQITATLEMKLAWLEINYKPEKTLLEYFNDTEPYRRQLLLVHKIEVHEYLKKFLGLRKTETAKKLWPVVRNCIYEELKSRQIKDLQDLVKLELITTEKLSEDETSCTILYLLALIIEPKRPGRKRKSKNNEPEQVAPVKRLSLSERRDSFIHVILTITDLESSIVKLKNDSSANKLSFQPTLVAIGPPHNPQSYKVILNDMVFNFNTLLEALDFTFQLFYTLDCKYPEGSSILWQFIQHSLYGILVPESTLSHLMRVLLGRIANFEANLAQANSDINAQTNNDINNGNEQNGAVEVKHLSRSHASSQVFSQRVPKIPTNDVVFNRLEPKKPRTEVPLDNGLQPQIHVSINDDLDHGCFSEDEYNCESDDSDSSDDFYEDDSDYFSSDDFGDASVFERKSDECAADSEGKLYMYSCIPRKTVTNVINDSSDLFDESLDIISEEIDQTSKTRNFDSNTISVVKEILNNHKNRLKKFKTERKCFRYFKNCDTFIYPESYTIGERQDYRKKDGEMSLVHIPYKTNRGCTLRNPDNYAELLTKNNPQESGLDGECVWNELDNFHATVNIGEDVMHDWYEGICRYDVATALYDFIYVQRAFTLKDLNPRIRSFYYGPKESTNKAPEILEHQLKNKCLIMTSAEMHCLVTRLPMIIGLIVPEGNEVLYSLIQMKRIIDIISSKVVQPETHKQLKVLISEYLESKRELFKGEKDKPKHHLGLHGPSSMERFGPLTKISALRFEAKNQEGKTISRTAKARVNVCRTIAMRHQLMFNYRLRMKKPYPHFETAEKKCVRLSKLNNVSEFVALLPLPNDCLCCREDFLRERLVTLNHCFDSKGLRYHNGSNAVMEVRVREPDQCYCSKCGSS
ncbi:hypothetical protein QAD02_007532 [Eretmocerus hayati]|uniref:Uncharacterized protein n=1 Tax=Eretmocerus hayati TaxID=131215 RepID=A0ACC2N3X4_9HYME|nr:hypothetical protein QAD02_007532 [Eretmocerus hayati]